MTDSWTWNNSKGVDPVIILWDAISSVDYDWWVTSIVMNSKGEYALYSASGCSCDGPYWNGWDECDLAWTNNLNEVKRQARERVGKTEKISVGRKADNLSKLSRLTKS